MEEESFIDAFGDVPTDLAGDYSPLYIFRTEDFGAWCRRVRNAHEREVDGGVAGMTDAELAEHGLCRIGSAAMWDEVRDTKDRELSEEHGLVRLPVDAYGMTIHVGDTLDGYGKTIEVVEMRHGRSGWVLISRDGSGYADTFAFAHRHEPTVEDVLQALTDEVWNRCCEGATASDSGIDELVAECAAKLRLAGENA